MIYIVYSLYTYLYTFGIIQNVERPEFHWTKIIYIYIYNIFIYIKITRLLDIDMFNNLSKEEREVLYSFKDDPSILMKDADKGSAVLVLDRKDYLMEAFRKLDERV